MNTTEIAVWTKIMLGVDYKKSPIFQRALDKALGPTGCPDGKAVKYLLQHPAFVTLNQPVEVELIRVSLEDLGYKQRDLKNLRHNQVCERGLERGWEYCPAEVAVQLLVQHSFADNEWLTLAMNQIPGKDGFGRILKVYCFESEFSGLTAADNEVATAALKGITDFEVSGNVTERQPGIVAGYDVSDRLRLNSQFVFISCDSAKKIRAAMAVPWKMKIWRQITLTTKLGRYSEGFSNEFPNLLKEKNIRFGNGAALMERDAFIEVLEEQTVDVVRVSVRELGGTNYTRYDEICELANAHELDWCPPQLAPELLLQCSKKGMGKGNLHVGMRSIRDVNGCPGIFRIYLDPKCDSDLSAIEAHPDTVFHPSDVFLFVKRNKKTAVL